MLLSVVKCSVNVINRSCLLLNQESNMKSIFFTKKPRPLIIQILVSLQIVVFFFFFSTVGLTSAPTQGITNSKKKKVNQVKQEIIKTAELQDTITNYPAEKKLIIELITHNLYLNYLTLNQLHTNFSYNTNNDMISKATLDALNELNLNLESYYDWLLRFNAKTNSEEQTISEMAGIIKQTKEVIELQKSYVRTKNQFEVKKIDKVFNKYKTSIIDFFNKYKSIK